MRVVGKSRYIGLLHSHCNTNKIDVPVLPEFCICGCYLTPGCVSGQLDLGGGIDI